MAAVAFGSAAFSAQAATTLTGEVTADNHFYAYVSTSADQQGTLLAEGHDWTTVQSFQSAALTPGTYYLNIVAENWDGVGGLVGSFSVGGQAFSTDLSWKTGYVPNAWGGGAPLGSAGQPSWTAPSGAAFSEGSTLNAYWGQVNPAFFSAIDPNAQWIWGADSASFPDTTEVFYQNIGYYPNTCQNCAVEFQTSFNVAAVPEPATWAMLILGMGAVGAVLRRRNSALLAA